MARSRGPHGGIDSDDDGPLPWLEPAEMSDDEEPVTQRKWIIAGVGVFLLALIGTVAVVYSGKEEDQYGTAVVAGSNGEPPLILAAKEPFRVRPSDPGGMRGEGEGLMIGAVARGQDPAPEVKLATGPEQPVERPVPQSRAAAPVAAPSAMTAQSNGAAMPSEQAAPNAAAGQTTPSVAATQKLVPPVTAQTAPANSAPNTTAARQAATQKTPQTTAVQQQKPVTPPQPAEVAKAEPKKPAETKKPVYFLQLGAFSSTDRAQAGWQQFSERYEQLKDLRPDIQPIKTGDKTMYRLRAGHISLRVRADSICAKLKAAGQPCIVAEQ